MNTELTQGDLDAIRSLRDRGFAVIVWTPGELGGTSPRAVEDRSVEHGYEVIESLMALQSEKDE